MLSVLDVCSVDDVSNGVEKVCSEAEGAETSSGSKMLKIFNI